MKGEIVVFSHPRARVIKICNLLGDLRKPWQTKMDVIAHNLLFIPLL